MTNMAPKSHTALKYIHRNLPSDDRKLLSKNPYEDEEFQRKTRI